MKMDLLGEETNVPKLLEKLDTFEVKSTDDIKADTVYLEMVKGKEWITLLTAGNISMIIGKAKSRKTFLLSLLASIFLSGRMMFGKFRATLPPNQQNVVYFDTEQSTYHISKMVKRICKLAGIAEPTNFKCFALRSWSTAERLKVIEEYIYTHDDLSVVIIDGVRDLITAINDEGESNKIKDLLMKWSYERNIHIISVLHQNKNDVNARGHVGSELTNKAETVLSVTKDKKQDISIVSSEYSRGVDIDDFAFTVNKEGLPELVDCFMNVDENQKKVKTTPQTVSTDIHVEVLTSIFALNESYKYADFCLQVKAIFADKNLSFGDNMAKDFVTFYANKKMVVATHKGVKTFYSIGDLSNENPF
jgi:hypothetical protein